MLYVVYFFIAYLWIKIVFSLFSPFQQKWSRVGFWEKSTRVLIVMWLAISPFVCVWMFFG